MIVYKRVRATLADESVRPPAEASRERQDEPGITSRTRVIIHNMNLGLEDNKNRRKWKARRKKTPVRATAPPEPS